MITNVNPKREAISWPEFLMLCKSCNLISSEPDVRNRYKFMCDQVEIMHQVTKLESGNLKSSGWFSYVFGTGGKWNGHKLTKGGHVAVIETINSHAPMTRDQQPSFVYMVERIFLSK